jgi:carboxylesterase
MRMGTAGTWLWCAALLFAGGLRDGGSSETRHDHCQAIVAPWLIAPVVLIAGYHAVTNHLASVSDRHAERDPETGILSGAESRVLGPEQSPGAVLVVHGFIGTPHDFNDLPERLAARGWHVRAILLPGHGTTPREFESESPETLLATVNTAYDSLSLSYERVVLLGHSMGASLCLLAAAERNPDAIVIATPYFSVVKKWYYGLKPETWARMLHPVVRWTYKGDRFMQLNRREAKDDIISYRWVPLDGVMTLLRIGDLASRPATLGAVRCPVLMIDAEHDEAASPEAARIAFGQLGSARKQAVRLEHSNHHIFWDYDRELVFDEIGGFLGMPDNPAYERSEPNRDGI